VRARDVAPPALAGERWLVGPAYGDLSRLIAERGLPPPELGAFATEAAAQAAAAAGEGLMLAIAQTVIDPLRRGSLGRVDLAGAPMDGMWHAVTLGAERSSREASALRRFVTTPEATQAIRRPSGRRSRGPVSAAGLPDDLERRRFEPLAQRAASTLLTLARQMRSVAARACRSVRPSSGPATSARPTPTASRCADVTSLPTSWAG
jgi:hypothetical protein